MSERQTIAKLVIFSSGKLILLINCLSRKYYPKRGKVPPRKLGETKSTVAITGCGELPCTLFINLTPSDLDSFLAQISWDKLPYPACVAGKYGRSLGKVKLANFFRPRR